MTKAEVAQLGLLIRKREKVMKAQATQRSAELLAEFDAHSAKIYHWDDDEVWAKAKAEAEAAIAEANAKIAERCKQYGIPAEFAPGVQFFWHGRGHNAAAQRRAELRRAAKSRIEALEAQAIARIEQVSLQAQTDVISQGLESDSAKLFLKSMPTMEALMPPLDVPEIQKLVDTAAEQRRKNADPYAIGDYHLN